GQARPLDAAAQEVASERDRVDDGAGVALAGEALELPVDEGGVEARVVRDEHGVACERGEAAKRGLDLRRAREVALREPGERAHRPRQGDARSDEGLEGLDSREPLDPDGADLADARRGGREPRRLEGEDAEARLLEERRRLRRERDTRAAPREPIVVLDERPEQRPGDGIGRGPDGEELARGLAGGDTPAALLDELDEAIE